jgi:hypothetical protein
MEALVRQQEDARFAQWLRSLSDEELMSHIADQLKTLSSEQLLRICNFDNINSRR